MDLNLGRIEHDMNAENIRYGRRECLTWLKLLTKSFSYIFTSYTQNMVETKAMQISNCRE